MEPVSSICFTDNDRKFVSFGDDKRVIQYELGYTVIIKNIFQENLGAICQSHLSRNKDFIYS